MGKFEAYYKDAERLAVREGMTQQRISKLLGISEKTLSQWSSDGEWMRQRKEYMVSTKTGPIQKLEARLLALLEDPEIDARKTDELYKIQLLIDRMKGGFDLKGAAIEVMDKFSLYLNRAEQDDKGFVERVGNHMHGFFEEIRRNT